MQRSSALIIAVAILFSSTPTKSETLEQEAKASVVEVESQSTSGSLIGAGIVVLRGDRAIDVLTAAHVVRGINPSIHIDRSPYAATIIKRYAGRDLALLRADVPSDSLEEIRPVRFGYPGRPDEPLFVWGARETGLVRHDATLIDDDFSLPTTTTHGEIISIQCEECDHGDSGGGIFKSDGTLVAILIARVTEKGTNKLLEVIGERVDGRTP